MKWNNNLLDMLGLNSTEVTILETLNNAKSILNISKESGLSRAGIKYSIEILITKGLVMTISHGKRKLYIALSELQLRQKIQHMLDGIVLESGGTKKGTRIRTSKENEFIIHVGTSEIIPSFTRIASMNKNERIKAIQHHRSHNEILEKLKKREYTEFNESIIKNHLIVDGILNEGAYVSYRKEILADPKKYKDSVKSLGGRMADYTVFPDDRFNHDAEIWIFKSTTIIINWKEEIAIEIINKSMTNFIRDMFEYVKEGGRKIDHNKMMNEIFLLVN